LAPAPRRAREEGEVEAEPMSRLRWDGRNPMPPVGIEIVMCTAHWHVFLKIVVRVHGGEERGGREGRKAREGGNGGREEREEREGGNPPP